MMSIWDWRLGDRKTRSVIGAARLTSIQYPIHSKSAILQAVVSLVKDARLSCTGTNRRAQPRPPTRAAFARGGVGDPSLRKRGLLGMTNVEGPVHRFALGDVVRECICALA